MSGAEAARSVARASGPRNGRERFGWQGFQFEHPDDWAPVTLSGGRHAGYARLASSGPLACHVRWERTRNPGDLESRLRGYFVCLEKQAKGRALFEASFERESDVLLYRWRADAQGRGALFFSGACSRVIFLEISGRPKDSLLGPLREVLRSFRSGASHGRVLWSLYGMRLWLPEALQVKGSRFRSGHTQLDFRTRGARVEAQRWAFAKQLVAKHGLEPWARAVLDMDGAHTALEPQGLRLRSASAWPPFTPPKLALVRVEPDRNQIVTLRSLGRDPGIEPQWDWFG